MVTNIEQTHVSRGQHEDFAIASTDGSAVRVVDRVRWASILAGVFGTLSVMAVLTTLGVAIGLSVLSRGPDQMNFGWGTGIFGGISALLAFGLGGYIAAGTSALSGRPHALIQGAITWAVTIGILAYVLAGGVGSAGNAAAAASTNENFDASRANTTSVDANRDRTRISDEDVRVAAQRSAKGAWGTFAVLLLSLGTALAGSHLGTRDPRVIVTPAL